MRPLGRLPHFERRLHLPTVCRGLCVAVVAPLAVGCTSGKSSSSTTTAAVQAPPTTKAAVQSLPSATTLTPTGMLVLTWPSAPPTSDTVAGMTALVSGRLVIDTGRQCVLLSNPEVGTKLVVWPYGTTLSPDGGELRFADGATLRDGDEVAGAGGYLPLHSLSGLEDVAVPASCDVPTDEVAVYNNGASPRRP